MEPQYILLIVCYFLVCLLVGVSGNEKPIGFAKVFWISILLSPIIGLVIGLLSKKYPPVHKCKYCSYYSSNESYYCVRCSRDEWGLTVEENKIKFEKKN